MSAPIQLRAAAREMWRLRRDHGDDVFRDALLRLPSSDVADLLTSWHIKARGVQLRPDHARGLWLLCWGRGSGKTRGACEDTLDACEDHGPGLKGALISKTIGDVRDTMIKGSSGLIACARERGYEVRYIANQSVVEHPSGATLLVRSAEQPDVGRGDNTNWIWGDELGAWGGDARTTFDVFLLAHRLRMPDGGPPSGVLTMTPKPNALSRYVLTDPKMRAQITYAPPQTTLDNRAIDPTKLIDLYGGTTLGQQELEGRLLDVSNLLTIDLINQHRVVAAPELAARVVAVDPSIDIKDTSDACGIVAAGIDTRPYPPHVYILEDATVQGYGWSQWAERTVAVAIAVNAQAIVAEMNQGAQGIVEALMTAMLELGREFPIVPVWHSVSKRARAEPCAGLAQKGRVHHVNYFPELEGELTTWVEGAPSPNAMDAWAMAITHLVFGDDRPTDPSFYLKQSGQA